MFSTFHESGNVINSLISVSERGNSNLKKFPKWQSKKHESIFLNVWSKMLPGKAT